MRTNPLMKKPVVAVLITAAGGVLALILVFVLAGTPTNVDRPEGREQQTSLSGLPPVPEVPETVTGVGWDWEAPENTHIAEIIAVPAGAAVVLNDGVVVLSGETGEELWRYRQVGAKAGVGRTPDRSVIAVHIEEGGEPSTDKESEGPRERIVSLDSGTGEVLAETDIPAEKQEFTYPSVMGERASGVNYLTGTGRLLMPADPDTALDLAHYRREDNDLLWESEKALECPAEGSLLKIEGAAATAEEIALLYSCSHEGERDYDTFLAAVDAATGELSWQLQAGGDFTDLVLWKLEAQDGLFILQSRTPTRETILVESGSGEVLADGIGSRPGEYVTNVMGREHLLSHWERAEDSGTGERFLVHYQVRDLTGQVGKEVSVGTSQVQDPLTFLLPLQNSLLKVLLRWEEGEPDGTPDHAEVAVFDWDSDSPAHHIRVDMDMDLSVDMDVNAAEERLGPGSFTAVPGAVVLTEVPVDGIRRKIVGLT